MARAETDPLPPHDAEQEPKKNPEASNGSTDEGTTNDEPPQDPNKPPNFGAGAPDGGSAAWLCVLGTWCTAFCSFGWINSVGVFQEYYQSGPLKSYSPSTISWIPSLQIFFMMGMGPVVGKIFDNWGPRHVLAIGSFMHVFGLMMASISSKYYQFLLAQGVCSAIGVAAIFQPSINCIPGWFFKKRGAAYGVVATGSSLGGIIFPIMISRLINQVGYGWALRSAAFLILALVLIANATVRSRLPPRRAARKDANGTVTTQPAAPSVPVWDIVREPGFLALMIGMFLITFGIFVPVTYLQVDAMQAGMRPGLAQYLIAIFNTGSLFGRILSGIAGDKIGRYNAFLIACACAGIVTLALWIEAHNSDGARIAYAVLFGFFSGAYVSLIGALVAQVSPMPQIGVRLGLVFLMCAVPGLVTSPIAGAILDAGSGRGQNWTGLKIFTGTFILGGTAVIFIARGIYTKWKLAIAF